jgi:hypothetical protein
VFGQLILSDGDIALDLASLPPRAEERDQQRPCCASC